MFFQLKRTALRYSFLGTIIAQECWQTFEQNRTALKYASLGMMLASMTPLNYAVAAAAATVFDDNLPHYQCALVVLVFSAAMIFPTAQFFLPYAIPCFAFCLGLEVLEWWMSIQAPNAPRV